ncbi:organic solute transporter subunit alpha isoform X2 [Pristis pectinata]|uniref:organic solute transporter subunit alpha isoform X2 n=1 Tax=Pristis pectinata TaxID=685728 RepID=UPI00223D27AC|nr:organic solute transporter subunit alpha isoform X2 [Pristis pectinata]
MTDARNESLEFYCGFSPPVAAEILRNLNLPAVILYSVLTLMAVIANLVYFEEVIYLLRKVPSTNRRATIMWVSGAAPVIASTSCIGMWVPLASMITDLTTAVRLMFMLKLGTFQLAFLRPVLMIFTLVLWVNGTFSLDDLTPSGPAIWINTSLGVSTIIALWPIGIVFNKVKGELKNQKIIPKFTLYQISFILTQLQAAILNITALSGGIACAPPLSPTARAGYMNQQLLIMEMFIITMLSRIYYRRKYNPLEIDEMQPSIKTQVP